MNLSVNQPNLSAGLAITSRAISSRTTMPVLSNVLLDATDDQLRLSATNREIGINVWLGAKVEDDGAVTVPAKLLSEFVNALPDDTVNMDLKQKTLTLHLACARYTANMKGIAADDFPLLPTVTDQQFADITPVSIETETLRTMIDRVTFAASADENRPTLTGVKFMVDGGNLTMAATDGFRLSVAKLESVAPNGNDDLGAIIPAKTLGTASVIAKDAESVEVFVTDRNVLFVFVGGVRAMWQRVELSSELIDARYPDYNATMPKEAATTATVDSKRLQQAINVAMLYARDNSNIVRFSVGDNAIGVSAQSAETGGSDSRIDCEVKGDGVDIAFNGRMILDALKRFDDLVLLELTQNTRPGLLSEQPPTDENGNKIEREFVHVVMPMRPPGA